jgi:hypothetical protein
VFLPSSQIHFQARGARAPVSISIWGRFFPPGSADARQRASPSIFTATNFGLHGEDPLSRLHAVVEMLSHALGVSPMRTTRKPSATAAAMKMPLLM